MPPPGDPERSISQTDMAMMAQFFQKALSFQGIPKGRLAKFTGPPYRAGELSLLEWLEEFEEIVAPHKPTAEEKARQLIEHLGGAAKEEVKCMSEGERKDYGKIVKALKTCFGAYESIQTLSSSFHNRAQQENESLSDFSRALKRLYSKMEMAAPTEEDSAALRHLRDGTLRSRFVGGARDAWIRRELRRIDMSTTGKTFDVMRQEALTLFQETEQMPIRAARAREVQVEALKPEEKSDQMSLIVDLLTGQKSLAASIERLTGELATLQSRLPNSQNSRRLPDLTCYACGKKGHFSKDCRSRQGSARPGPNQWTPRNPSWQPQPPGGVNPAPVSQQGNF